MTSNTRNELVSKEEPEKMQEALKRVEAGEIAASIENALDDVAKGHTYPIEELWRRLDDPLVPKL